MRVLHVIPSVAERSGGPATAIIPMCCALRQQGIDVLLLTTTAGLPGNNLANGEVVDYKGVPAIFFPSQLGESFKYSRPLASWLNANIQNFGMAHIHAVFNHSSRVAAQACHKAAVPYIVRPLGTLDPWSMAQKPLRKRLFWYASGKAMLRRAAAVHYTSEGEKLSTERYLGLNHGRVIALGIDENSSDSKDKLAHLFPHLEKKPYVLALSRLHRKKGLDVLIDAFLSLVHMPEFADWSLVIAGDGAPDYVSKLKAKIAPTVHRDRIIFTGWLEGEQKNAVLAGASLLVLPSQHENFGFCVMEALSHSVPVLVSPNVNLAREIASANAGWIAAIDKNALAEKLAEALRDKDELAKRGCAGKQFSQKYSWENAARNLIDLYSTVLAQTDGGVDIHRA